MSFSEDACSHFIHHANQHLDGQLHGGHLPLIHARAKEALQKLHEHLRAKDEHEASAIPTGGAMAMGGSMHMGGSLHMGGAIHFTKPPPNHPVGMYHYALRSPPQHHELMREISHQLLGAHPSKMWGKLVEPTEPLESEPEHYENIVRMPNVHATAKMIEGEHGYTKGGGFFKALRHVANKASEWYKKGHAALGWANKHRDTITSLPYINNYKAGIDALLDTANHIDSAVNPMVEAANSTIQNGLSEENKAKLKQYAEKGLDAAVDKYLPNQKHHYEAAKSLRNTYNEYQETKHGKGKHKQGRHAKAQHPQPAAPDILPGNADETVPG